MAIQGLQFTILSSQEAHQSYQATGSFVVYNPNDGVAYVATDRTATGLSWDYKVPSQSGGRFPGPINSYLSIFYLDQSGSGQQGQVVVYASPDSVTIPHFWSIGRALQGQTTSMDVIQGSQPGNPGSGVARLWVDSSGHLHILLSDGTDRTLIDTTNWGTIPLGGDLTGTTGNAYVSLRNNSDITAHDTGGTNHALLGLLSDNNVWFYNAGAGLIRFINQTGSAELGHIDNSGNLVMGGNISGRDVLATRGGNQGVIYFDQQAGTHYLYYDGSNFNFVGGPILVGAGPSNISGSLHVGGGFASDNGYVYFNQPSSVFIYWDGTNLHTSHGVYISGSATIVGNEVVTGWLSAGGQNNPNAISWGTGQTSGGSINASGYEIYPALATGGQCMSMIAWTGALANANCFLAPNIGDYRGQALAQAWGTWSSVDHARQYNLPVAPVKDPLALVRSITGYYYAHTSMKGKEPILRDTGEVESNMTYGFAAAEVNAQIPEMATDEWVDTSRLIAILWEAVKELDARTQPVTP